MSCCQNNPKSSHDFFSTEACRIYVHERLLAQQLQLSPPYMATGNISNSEGELGSIQTTTKKLSFPTKTKICLHSTKAKISHDKK